MIDQNEDEDKIEIEIEEEKENENEKEVEKDENVHDEKDKVEQIEHEKKKEKDDKEAWLLHYDDGKDTNVKVKKFSNCRISKNEEDNIAYRLRNKELLGEKNITSKNSKFLYDKNVVDESLKCTRKNEDEYEGTEKRHSSNIPTDINKIAHVSLTKYINNEKIEKSKTRGGKRVQNVVEKLRNTLNDNNIKEDILNENHNKNNININSNINSNNNMMRGKMFHENLCDINMKNLGSNFYHSKYADRS